MPKFHIRKFCDGIMSFSTAQSSAVYWKWKKKKKKTPVPWLETGLNRNSLYCEWTISISISNYVSRREPKGHNVSLLLLRASSGVLFKVKWIHSGRLRDRDFVILKIKLKFSWEGSQCFINAFIVMPTFQTSSDASSGPLRVSTSCIHTQLRKKSRDHRLQSVKTTHLAYFQL